MAKKSKTLKADTWALARSFAEKYAVGRGSDVGAVEVGILDIYDSAVGLYGDVLPRVARLEDPSPDDLLEEMVDLRMELEHIDYHARLALRGLRRIESELRKANGDAHVAAQPSQSDMTLTDYASDVLERAGSPLHCEELFKRILERQGDSVRARNWHSLNKQINTEIRTEGERSRFYKDGRTYGVGLAQWRGSGGRD